MLILFDRMRRDEEGQTLVLGAISMLVLAIAVMTTLSIGHAAYEKIKLQNTADAGAYTLAATQARVYNFYAYTNRAMIAHYNSMLTFAAYLSFALYNKHTIGRFASIAKFIPVPVLSQVLALIEKIIDITVQVLQKALEYGLKILVALNFAYFVFQSVMTLMMAAAVLAQPDTISENDPDVKTEVTGLSGSDVLPALAKIANGFNFYQAIDVKSIAKLFPKHPDFDKLVNPQPEGNEGRIVMNELINNARHPWVAGSKDGLPFLGRVWDLSFFIVSMRKRARTEHGNRTGGGGAGLYTRHDQIFSIETFDIRLDYKVYWWKFHYEARVVADRRGGYEMENAWTDDKDCGWDPLCNGAKATMWGFPITGAMTAVLSAIALLFNGIRIPKNYVYAVGSGNFKVGGITPYLKFNPVAKWRQTFNQPQFMTIAIKEDDKLNLYTNTFQRAYGVDFHVNPDNADNGRGNINKTDLSIDVTGSDIFSKIAPGFKAISVATTYYHRPGEWREHPNFFNPFWAAKLDPVAHHKYVDYLHLSNFADEVLTH